MSDGAERRGYAWFEGVYTNAAGDADKVPWADMEPNRPLMQWLDAVDLRGEGRRALVVGCGLGDDAEEMVRRGFEVAAFDISPTAVKWARERFPASEVDYRVADLFAPPAEWPAAFDVVIEIYTVHALNAEMRPDAMRAVARFVRPGGELLFICRGRDDGPAPPGPPHPLSRAELTPLAEAGLEADTFEDITDDEGIRRFRVRYRKPF